MDEKVTTARYQRIAGEGPAYAKAKNKNGPVEATILRDTQVVSYRRYEKKALVEIGSFDAYGVPLAKITFGPGEAALSAVAAGAPADLSTWTRAALPGVSALVPAVGEAPGRVELRFGPITGALVVVEGGEDPLSAGFREAFAAECGCVLLDRHTAWLGEQVGVRYRLRLPTDGADLAGELFAFRKGERLVLLSGTGPDEASLAPLHAVVATARWEGK